MTPMLKAKRHYRFRYLQKMKPLNLKSAKQWYIFFFIFPHSCLNLRSALSDQVQGRCDDLEQGRAMGAFNGQTPRCWPGGSGNNRPVSGRLNSAAPVCRRAPSRARVFIVLTSTAFEFKRFTGTRLLAQFNKDVKSVMKMSLKFSTGNVLKPKYKLRVLRVRLTSLEGRERWAVAAVPRPASGVQNHWPACLCRPLCRYDIVVEEDREVTFRPFPCQDSNFWG